MIVMSEIVQKSGTYNFWTNLAKFPMIACIFGPFWKKMQSYMIHFRSEIASILGPLYNKNRIHIDPHFNHDCKLIEIIATI